MTTSEAWEALQETLETAGLLTSSSRPSSAEAHMIASWSALRILGQGPNAPLELTTDQVTAIREMVRDIINVTCMQMAHVAAKAIRMRTSKLLPPPHQVGQ